MKPLKKSLNNLETHILLTTSGVDVETTVAYRLEAIFENYRVTLKSKDHSKYTDWSSLLLQLIICNPL